jgi:hypothetical protein
MIYSIFDILDKNFNSHGVLFRFVWNLGISYFLIQEKMHCSGILQAGWRPAFVLASK